MIHSIELYNAVKFGLIKPEYTQDKIVFPFLILQFDRK